MSAGGGRMGDWIPCEGHARFTTTAVKRCWQCADATIAALESENRELRKYADHIWDCPVVAPHTPTGSNPKCTCGFGDLARSAAKRGPMP